MSFLNDKAIDTNRWIRWSDYFGAAMILAAAVGVIAYNTITPTFEPNAFVKSALVILLWFFMIAPILAICAIVTTWRRSRSQVRRAFQFSIFLLTLFIHPILQIWIAPFHWRYAQELEARAQESQLIGKSESEAIARLGQPFYSKPLQYEPNAKQLRYQHWWPMWLFGAEVLVDVKNGRVTRVVIRR